MSDPTAAQRQKRRRERLAAAGMVLVRVWVPKTLERPLRELIARWLKEQK